MSEGAMAMHNPRSRNGNGLATPLAVRFERLTCPEPNSGCLLWLGRPDKRGYGKIEAGTSIKRKGMLAHRLAWILAGREIPEGFIVMHSCDNPACVNVRHLGIGSALDNSRDMQSKARGTKSKRGLPRGVVPTGFGRFQANVHTNRKFVYIGTYDTAEEASAAVETTIRSIVTTV